MIARVLAIAGSDCGGGAGIQADIKTITALGGYAMSAITALTAQDTRTVHQIAAVEPSFIARQIEVCLGDIGADAIKTGMLHDVPVIEAVARAIAQHGAGLPLIADPVMLAKGGAALLEVGAVDCLKRALLPMVTVLTPNLPEAEILAGMAIEDLGAMKRAADSLRSLGPRAVLLKGGHLPGRTIHDVLADEHGIRIFDGPRLETSNTHGTGCTLASAIATGLAQGLALADAVERARAYVRQAIRTAPGLGGGHGPLNHGHTAAPFDGPRNDLEEA
jgi:hydroxymethylpyrimidine/phosphomethylpyrimidine kinase